jgi:NADPH-dependent curcumin reductase CurA
LQCGFDLAINYKTDDVKAAVAAFAPEGVHHYFDNVGGHITDSILQVIAYTFVVVSHAWRAAARLCIGA